MSILDELVEVLCLAEDLDVQTLNRTILNERIMSKKQARKLRKQQELAKKKAEQEKAQKEQQANDTEEDKQEQNNPGTQLITYDPNYMEEVVTDYSENFKKFIELFNQLIQKYGPEFEKGVGIWKAQGNEKLCPEDAYKILKAAIDGLQQESQTLVEQTLPQLQEGMHDQELDYINLQMTALSGFLEKKSQLIESIHPEAYIEGETVEETPELTGDQTPELTGAELLALPDKSKKKDDKEYKDLLYYEEWAKSNKDVDEIWKKIRDNEEEVSKLGWGDFIKKHFHPMDWFGDRLWAIITSPLAKDIVKAIMYCNPITAALFDGYIVGFGIKKGLKNIKNWRDKRKAKGKPKRDKSFYDERHIPKDISKLKLHELYNELHGNEEFVGWINAGFNHPEVTAPDKSDLRRFVRGCDRAFEQKKVADFRNYLTKLIDKVSEICDYMKWETYKDLQQAQLEATGNTKEEMDNIKKRGKEDDEKDRTTNKHNEDIKKLIQDILNKQQTTKSNTTTLTPELLNTMKDMLNKAEA